MVWFFTWIEIDSLTTVWIQYNVENSYFCMYWDWGFSNGLSEILVIRTSKHFNFFVLVHFVIDYPQCLIYIGHWTYLNCSSFLVFGESAYILKYVIFLTRREFIKLRLLYEMRCNRKSYIWNFRANLIKAGQISTRVPSTGQQRNVG